VQRHHGKPSLQRPLFSQPAHHAKKSPLQLVEGPADDEVHLESWQHGSAIPSSIARWNTVMAAPALAVLPR